MTAINHEGSAKYAGLSFQEYHEREQARLTALLVHAAGGKIRLTRKQMMEANALQLVQSMDHATGDVVFSTDPDVEAFNVSFGEAQ